MINELVFHRATQSVVSHTSDHNIGGLQPNHERVEGGSCAQAKKKDQGDIYQWEC